MKKPVFNSFLGIDQTGAVDPRNNPRPLSAVLIWEEQGQWCLESGKLQSLTAPIIKKGLKECGSSATLPKTCILLDSVLGLPENCSMQGLYFKDLLKEAKNFEFNGRGFGRKVAEKFFEKFWVPSELENSITGSKRYPRRRAEILAQANSVFQVHPHQKNIGCGTYRCWKELSQDTSWFQTILDSHFKEPSLSTQQTWIFEVYPSYFWKKFGYKTRQPNRISELVFSSGNFKVSPKTLKKIEDPNLADATVAALGAYALQNNNELWNYPREPWIQYEGWILGIAPG